MQTTHLQYVLPRIYTLFEQDQIQRELVKLAVTVTFDQVPFVTPNTELHEERTRITVYISETFNSEKLFYLGVYLGIIISELQPHPIST